MSLQNDFNSMSLSPEVLVALSDMGFTSATPIQAKTIPAMLGWHDIIAKAPTGTGKTCAFGVPIIEHLEPENKQIQALILAPTRELTLQIADEMAKLAVNQQHIRITAIYGGQSIRLQLQQLKNKPQIVVATPGRLIDHLNRRTISLAGVHTVILDEADRMLDMGFVKDVRSILDRMPRVEQIAMFSATMSRSVMDISWIYQQDVIELEVAEDDLNKPPIEQFSIEASSRERPAIIRKLMERENISKAIVFCNTKYNVEAVTRQLRQAGLKADMIHGGMQQQRREKVISAFRKGKVNLLVATDVASRGLDIEQVDAVFNYDIPEENERYTHRIGRTGRARRSGMSYTFTTPVTESRFEEIIRYTRSLVQKLVIRD